MSNYLKEELCKYLIPDLANIVTSYFDYEYLFDEISTIKREMMRLESKRRKLKKFDVVMDKLLKEIGLLESRKMKLANILYDVTLEKQKKSKQIIFADWLDFI